MDDPADLRARDLARREWVSQLNEDQGHRLSRKVSARSLWPDLELVEIPAKNERGSKLVPSGHTPIPNKLLFDYDLSDKALRVYGLLRAMASLYLETWWVASVPIPFLAANMGVTERAVQGYLDELRAAGHISDLKELHPNYPRAYKLTAE